MADTRDASVPRPFQINIPVDDVYRMRRLVEETRLPESPPIPAASWDYGVDLDWLKDLQQQWATKFDWKTVEANMNSFSHFKVVIESVDLHFIHQRSDRQDAVPLLLLNGWPGSFWEFHKAIPLLTNPRADQPAFHVVVPSLPGFGFSSPPPKQGWGMDDNARIFDYLVTGVLGYKSYVASGSDFGSMICTHLGSSKFPACKLVQIVGGFAPPTLGAKLSLPFFLLPKSWRQWLYSKIYTEFELQGMARLGWFMKGGLGYFVEQATRPFTIGYALHDSPIGQLSWIGEKYKEVIHPDRAAEAKDFILATVSLTTCPARITHRRSLTART